VDDKIQLIQEEVARINQISEYDNSIGSTKTLGNDLSKIVIHHTKQLIESKSMLTESVSDIKDTDFNLNNIFATMDGNNLIVDGYVVDLKTEESKGHLFDDNFLTYLEIAENQRDTLYREGLYEASYMLNDTILRISDRLRKHGEIILDDGQIFEQFDWIKKKYNQGKKYVKKKYKQVKKAAGDIYDKGKKFLSDKWETVKKYAGDGYDWIKDKANAAWKWTKENFLAILAKGFIWIAQTLEAALFSVAGIVVDVVLGFTGYGAIPMMVLWGIVAVYRIYVWIKEGGWMNFLMIICCLMGMLPGGAVLAKVFRGGASILKGVTSTGVAASKLSKAFKPSQVNWLGKVMQGMKSLLDYVFKGLNWLLKHVPGFSGISAKLGNFGTKISKRLNVLLWKMGKPVTMSSTAVKVLGGGVLGYEIYKAFSEGMNLQDIKDTELVLYDDYKPDNEGGYVGVGEMVDKISMERGDFEVRSTGKKVKKLVWIAKKGSPQYKNMMKHPYFDGYTLIEDEPYGQNPTVWKVNTCSKKYGCPNGFKMENGVAVQEKLDADEFKDYEFTQEQVDGYEAEADAAVEKQWRLDHPEEYQ
jgi:hypothetical protein